MTRATVRYLLLFSVAWIGITAILVVLLALANLIGRHYGVWWQYGSLVIVVGIYSAFMVRGFLQDVGPAMVNPNPRTRPDIYPIPDQSKEPKK